MYRWWSDRSSWPTLVLKDHWARMRPADMVQFGGAEQITAWWDPTDRAGQLFVHRRRAVRRILDIRAGPRWRRRNGGRLLMRGVLIFGAAMGVLRMAGGAHFFSDVVFAGVFMFLVVWTLHGLIYRWRPTRIRRSSRTAA